MDNCPDKAGVFYDAETGGPARIILEAIPQSDTFRLLRSIRYRDHEYDEPFIVPVDPDTFTTDLGSVPWYMAWVIPSYGEHLGAFLVHDALIPYPGESKAYEGPDVTRSEADRIMRDAMGKLGSTWIRRWITWSAVSLQTAWVSTWRWKLVVALTMLIIVSIGLLATFQLFGIGTLIPWMMSSVWYVNLFQGAIGATVIPCFLSALWWPRWRVGAIAGTTLALLLHVTIAIFSLYLVYSAVEKIGQGLERFYMGYKNLFRRNG